MSLRRWELFVGFLKVSLCGFGGGLGAEALTTAIISWLCCT